MSEFSINSASKMQQMTVQRKIDNAIMSKTKELQESNGEQIIKLVQNSTINQDPDIGRNIDLMI